MEKYFKIGVRMFYSQSYRKKEINNAKYHSRLVERTPSINMKKDELIKYMIKQNIDIPNPIPAKPVLLEKIREKNIPEQYVIDSMA